MAAARQSRSYEKHLSCPVCMDLLTDPRALPCMHTFCAKCIHTYITSVCTKGTERGFDCPVCRRYTRPSFKGLHPYSWADNFPLNFALKGIIDDIKRKSDEIRNDSAMSERASGGNDIRMCTSHPHRPVEFICEDHESLVCSICAAMQHRTCAHVHFMEGTIALDGHVTRERDNNIDHNNPSTEVPTKGPATKATSAAGHKKHKSVTRLCKSASLDSGIDDRSNVTPFNPESLVHEFANARTIDGENSSSTTEPRETQEAPKASLNRLCGNIEHTGSQGGASSDCRKENIEESFERPEFGRGLSRHGYNSFSLGNLNDIIEEEEEMVVVNVDTSVSKSQILLQSEHYVRSQHDTKCCSITGLASMPDGRMLLADENNSNVKLFDVNGVFQAYLDLPTEPFDVTAIGDYEAAATCPNAKRVHIFLVHDTMLSPTRTIDLDKKCYGISYFKKDIFIAVENEVRVLNYNGEKLHRIVTEPQKKRLFSLQMHKALFRGARYLCYDGSALVGMLHVSDCDKSCVTTLDRKGGVMSKMRLGEGGAPMGMSLGEKGQMFVCQKPNRLVTISIGEHGNRIKPLADVDKILSVQYNRTSKMLWVSRRQNNFIKVYTVRS